MAAAVGNTKAALELSVRMLGKERTSHRKLYVSMFIRSSGNNEIIWRYVAKLARSRRQSTSYTVLKTWPICGASPYTALSRSRNCGRCDPTEIEIENQ
jgi:hypothetical protein